MILFARKKYLRDERLLQLMFLLSLLRGSPDLIIGNDVQLPDLLERDLALGNSLGQSQLSPSILTQTLHPKSLDRVLAGYQRSVLQDLNTLGSYADPTRIRSRLGHLRAQNDIQAYLLNAESSLGQPSTPEEGGYVSAPPSPDAIEESIPQDHVSSGSVVEWVRSVDEDLFEDLELLQAIWKQDVDLGVPREIFEHEEIEDDPQPQQEHQQELASKLDLDILEPRTKEKDHGKEPCGSSEIAEIPGDKNWTSLNFTVDSETGELLASNSSSDEGLEGVGPTLSCSSGASNLPPRVNDSSLHLEFNLDEALKLVGLNSSSDTESQEDYEADSGCGDSGASDFGGDGGSSSALDALNDSLDDMIQASQLHPHHPRNFQGRLGGLVRSGSMEQRWQDLASLLSLPSPDPAHHAQSPPTPTMASHAHPPPPPPIHHPHALYPTHEGQSVGAATSPSVPRGVLIHNATIPPPMPDAHNITYTNSMGASSHLVASSMNLTNNSDIPGSEHHNHYKMETSSNLPPDMMYYQNSGAEINQTTDGFLSSILNDEDLQLMDIPMTDYNNRGGSDYGGGSYRYPTPDDPHRLPPVAQKKHQMFGKRFFHENPHAGGPTPNLGGGNSNVVGVSPIVGPYPSHYQSTPVNQPMEGATAMDPSEMKYSCTMDFRTPEVSGAAVEHVQHNHTYHMSPEGPSGIIRPNGRDKKGRKSDLEKSLSRDEKRARAMNLPMTCDDIINLPMDEFNERISKFDLTEAQLSLIRDIRRRGKNKVAAQNCRKRKLDQIVHLAEEVKVIQYRKNELHSQLDHLSAERSRIKHKFSLLYRHIFQSLRDPDGNPYSPHEYSLQQSADGSILLVPRSSPPPMDHKGRHTKGDGGH